MIYSLITEGTTLEEVQAHPDFDLLCEAEREAIVDFYQTVPSGVNLRYLDLDVIDKSGKVINKVRLEI